MDLAKLELLELPPLVRKTRVAIQATTPHRFPGTCYPLLQQDSPLARMPFYPRFCRNAPSPSSPDQTACRDALKKINTESSVIR